ncbi:MAG: hypothetical protein E7313_05000 [Clostridiales bacterium]|nr:hypothetical protein [Clostridiales bacterium]
MHKKTNIISKILMFSIIIIIAVTAFSNKIYADAGYDKTYSGSSSTSSNYSNSSSSTTTKEYNSLISNQTTTSKEIKDNSKEDIKNLESKISDLSEKIDNTSKTNLYLIIALAVIGTISIISFMITIIVLIKRKNN